MSQSPKFPQKLIVGNWKMNGLRERSVELARDVVEGALRLPDDVGVVICPPFTQLSQVHTILDASKVDRPVMLGAQDCHTAVSGAHTGDISPEMLADLGVKYVILGHSERRQAHGETNAEVRLKVEAAQRAGLIPIVCIGETHAEREDGKTASVLGSQIEGSLTDDFNGVLAYEPVWAIGTGATPAVDELEQAGKLLQGLLRARLKKDDIRVPILYGGSVNPAQAPAILSIGSLGGVLVGSASLEASSFLAIARAASVSPST